MAAVTLMLQDFFCHSKMKGRSTKGIKSAAISFFLGSAVYMLLPKVLWNRLGEYLCFICRNFCLFQAESFHGDDCSFPVLDENEVLIHWTFYLVTSKEFEWNRRGICQISRYC